MRCCSSLSLFVPLQNIRACKETILDGAQLYVDEQEEAKVGHGSSKGSDTAQAGTHTAPATSPTPTAQRLPCCLRHTCCILCLTLQLSKLREQLVILIKQEQQLKRHNVALGHLQSTYQPSLDNTDFKEILDQQMQQQAAADR